MSTKHQQMMLNVERKVTTQAKLKGPSNHWKWRLLGHPHLRLRSSLFLSKT
jgi:hypothetical protein